MNKAILLFALLLVGCAGAGVVCNEPYISVGDSCCLDKDANGICDSDEGDVQECEETLDCSACPPNIITETETIEITKFVCSDSRTTVKNLEDCEEAMHGPEVIYTPITTNEEDQTVIEEFTIRPACRGGYQAMEIHLTVSSNPSDVRFQVKTDPKESFKDLHVFNGSVFDKYMYGVFCEDQCTNNADFFIDPGKKYLFRAKFDLTESSWEKVFKTNEHVIDATDRGEYMTKLC